MRQGNGLKRAHGLCCKKRIACGRGALVTGELFFTKDDFFHIKHRQRPVKRTRSQLKKMLLARCLKETAGNEHRQATQPVDPGEDDIAVWLLILSQAKLGDVPRGDTGACAADEHRAVCGRGGIKQITRCEQGSAVYAEELEEVELFFCRIQPFLREGLNTRFIAYGSSGVLLVAAGVA